MTALTPTQLQKLSKSELLNLVRRGIVKVNMDILLTDLSEMTKYDQPEYQQYNHLAGQAITISEAARKYNLHDRTIGRWVKRGYIKRIGLDKNRILIDEADTAYCAMIYKQRGGQGKWLFNPDGTPYNPTTTE